MSKATTVASIKDLLRFPFQGPDWQNRFLIGSALVLLGSFIPIVPFIFVLGYVLELVRRAAQGEELTLPDWHDWGKLAVDGLRALAVQLVFLLPGLLIMVVGIGLYFVATFAMPLMSMAGESEAVVFSMFFLFGSMGIMFLGMAAGSLLLLLGAIPLPAALVHLSLHDKVSAGLRIREWWPILRANKLGFLVAWVIVGGVWAIVYAVYMVAYYTICLCCLLPVIMAPASFYLLLIGAAVFGQAYRDGAEMVAEAQEEVADEELP